MARRLIINADDFGFTDGINRGVVDCHVKGVVTSASLMVFGAAAEEAASLAAQLPALSVGLHWVGDQPGAEVDVDDPDAVNQELDHQLARFHALLGRAPDHLDSHHHLHLDQRLLPLVSGAAGTLQVPLRGAGPITYIGGFYAQLESGITELGHVSVEALQRILREQVGEGWSELSCHPGYRTAQLRSTYSSEREAEIKTLTDPRTLPTIEELGITLESFSTYPAEAA